MLGNDAKLIVASLIIILPFCVFFFDVHQQWKHLSVMTLIILPLSFYVSPGCVICRQIGCVLWHNLCGLLNAKSVGACGVMVIVVGNGHGDTSLNPGRDWLHFT